MPDYLYRIVQRSSDRWELLQAEVEKRTAKTIYFKERTLASQFYLRVHTDDLGWVYWESPRAAWEAWADSKMHQRVDAFETARLAGIALDYAEAQLKLLDE